MTKSFGKKVYFGFLIFVILGFFVLFGKDIHFHFGAPGKIGYSGENIENIEGELHISPNYIFDWYINKLLSTEDIVYMEVYNFTFGKLKDIFSYLAKDGVDINILMEKNQYKQGAEDFQDLKNNLTGKNIDIYSDKAMDKEFLHSKFLVLDDSFIIQTANLNYSSFFNNREYFFTSKNDAVRKSLVKIFKKDKRGMPLNKEDIHPNLLVCDFNCRGKFQDYLNKAKESIYIQTQSISDGKILDILDKKNDGLDMKVMLADLDTNKSVKKRFNDDVKIFKDHYLHAKSILIDEKYLILGSMNLTRYSLDENREVSIVLINDEIINKYLSNFKDDWK